MSRLYLCFELIQDFCALTELLKLLTIKSNAFHSQICKFGMKFIYSPVIKPTSQKYSHWSGNYLPHFYK